MDRNDQQAIDGLFSKLAHVEQQSGQRDAESDRFIQERINQQPGAPYYMAQTIVVQEQALEAAQRRIEELENQNQQGGQRQAGGGGFFSSMFGGSQQPQQRAAPRQASYSRPPASAGSPWGNQGQAGYGQQQPQRGGGGFLAGAAQTAMGVAGGVLLGNAIGGMFGGPGAQAAEPEAAAPDAEAPAEDMDFGGDEEI
ncbi:hypothetical protein SAMN03159496_05497 [Rhizobium sp. NFR07]|uniref:DUF2076 domain-containing protein n=1 Tax=Rhizobium sp. NFR07 TaxID=1566262 RepID=UPI0008EC706E|nr:DUF2076 domain-containing protein [Rhizobium sp. NFR07]SFB59257.1 hypothetical protein SAMN03159496_05497 [Rhizobium sp. NFR07]